MIMFREIEFICGQIAINLLLISSCNPRFLLHFDRLHLCLFDILLNILYLYIDLLYFILMFPYIVLECVYELTWLNILDSLQV